VRIALAQVNTIVGDLEGNTRLITDWIQRAREQGADIVAFPELALTGYPPEDLVLKPGFVRDNLKQLTVVARATKGISAVVGFVDEDGDLYNAAAYMSDGEVKAVYHKVFLPNYGVFDEQRYFAAGGGATQLFGIGGVRVGISVCEDAWSPTGPIAEQAERNPSPRQARPEEGRTQARETDGKRPASGQLRVGPIPRSSLEPGPQDEETDKQHERPAAARLLHGGHH